MYMKKSLAGSIFFSLFLSTAFGYEKLEICEMTAKDLLDRSITVHLKKDMWLREKSSFWRRDGHTIESVAPGCFLALRYNQNDRYDEHRKIANMRSGESFKSYDHFSQTLR